MFASGRLSTQCSVQEIVTSRSRSFPIWSTRLANGFCSLGVGLTISLASRARLPAMRSLCRSCVMLGRASASLRTRLSRPASERSTRASRRALVWDVRLATALAMPPCGCLRRNRASSRARLERVRARWRLITLTPGASEGRPPSVLSTSCAISASRTAPAQRRRRRSTARTRARAGALPEPSRFAAASVARHERLRSWMSVREQRAALSIRRQSFAMAYARSTRLLRTSVARSKGVVEARNMGDRTVVLSKKDNGGNRALVTPWRGRSPREEHQVAQAL